LGKEIGRVSFTLNMVLDYWSYKINIFLVRGLPVGGVQISVAKKECEEDKYLEGFGGRT
jgi:hypothetical protein